MEVCRGSKTAHMERRIRGKIHIFKIMCWVHWESIKQSLYKTLLTWWVEVKTRAVCRKRSSVQFSSVQSLSCVRLFATPWIAACQASLSITNSRSSPRLMSIKLVMPSSCLILCHPLSFRSQSLPASEFFSTESTLRMRWPKYWSFNISIIPSKEHPGLISFRMDWLDLLAVQGTLKSLLQHHSSKASINYI